MNDYQTLKVALEEKLELLQRRLGKISHDLRQAAEPDSVEQAASRENDEVLESLDHTGREELKQLHAAIARIDAGTWQMYPVRRGDLTPTFSGASLHHDVHRLRMINS